MVQSNESANDLTILGQHVSIAQTLLVSRLLWPEFVEVRGCVLLKARYTEANFEKWWANLDGNTPRVEGVINHLHLWDVFAGDLPDDAPEFRAMEELGMLLRDSWRAALATSFPGRGFEVTFATEPEEYGPTVSFWSAAP